MSEQWTLSKLQIDTKNKGKTPVKAHERNLRHVKFSMSYNGVIITLEQTDHISDSECVVIPYSNPENMKQRNIMLFPSVDKHLKRSIRMGEMEVASALLIE